MKTLIAAIAAVLTLAGAALAAEGGNKSGPCREDALKFCKDVRPGDGRKAECLKAHEAELSAACKAELEQKRKERHKKNPCLADREKLCAGKEGKERGACMREHEKELSEVCAAYRAGLKHAKKKGKGAGKPQETAKPAAAAAAPAGK